MTTNLFEFALLSFVSLLTMLNPIGIIPVYVSMTSKLSSRESRHVAVRASIAAFGMLLLFAIGGKLIFDFFHISIDSLRIVGGMIFFLVGYEMFQARIPKMKYEDEETKSELLDQAVTPIGIPLICGPGSITTVMLLMKESGDFAFKSILILSIFIAVTVTMILLIYSKRILRILGDSGKKVLMRIMGLLGMVISVDLFFNGLKPILKEILCA
ncbi:MAG: MarC family protein [Calditrichaeota bacterium]|nr:MAG: MarC family protein [Calditrichota bacterium]